MAKVSISEAARLVGLSRQQLYRRHLGDDAELSNRLSTEKDGKGGVFVDTSELLRVFGSLQDPDSQKASNGGAVTATDTPAGQLFTQQIDGAKLAALEVEARMLREQLRGVEQQLAEAKDREATMWSQAKDLTVGLRLLEDKSKEVSEVVKADSALIAELKKQLKRSEADLVQSRKVNKELRELLATERNRGIFARLTGR